MNVYPVTLNNNIIKIIFQYLKHEAFRKINYTLLNKNLLNNFCISKSNETFSKPILETDFNDKILCILENYDILTKSYIMNTKQKVQLAFDKDCILKASYLGNFKIAIVFPKMLNIYSYNSETLTLSLIKEGVYCYAVFDHIYILKNTNIIIAYENGYLLLLSGKTYSKIASHYYDYRINQIFEVSKNRFVAFSQDRMIRIWDAACLNRMSLIRDLGMGDFVNVESLLQLRNGDFCIGLEHIREKWNVSYGIWNVLWDF
jgi:hypothetical protein